MGTPFTHRLGLGKKPEQALELALPRLWQIPSPLFWCERVHDRVRNTSEHSTLIFKARLELTASPIVAVEEEHVYLWVPP